MRKKRGDRPEAVDPKCGYHCYGWALTELEHQTCPNCGSKLELKKGGRQSV